MQAPAAIQICLCSNLGPVKKQKKGEASLARPADQTGQLTVLAEAPSTDANDSQHGGYASSSDEEEERHNGEVVQELQEEVCRLHDQVQPEPLNLSATDVQTVSCTARLQLLAHLYQWSREGSLLRTGNHVSLKHSSQCTAQQCMQDIRLVCHGTCVHVHNSLFTVALLAHPWTR